MQTPLSEIGSSASQPLRDREGSPFYYELYQLGRGSLRQAPIRRGVIVGIFLVFASHASAQDLQAEKIYSWDFQRSSDTNFDQMPDGWQRRQDRQHPAYVDMRIQPREPETAQVALYAQGTLTHLVHAWRIGRWEPSFIAETTPPAVARFFDQTVLDNCLEIKMDGGAAELVSPLFPMESRFTYSLRAEMSCRELNGHVAWIELQLLDESKQLVKALSTDKLRGTSKWQAVSTEAASISNTQLKWGRVHLKVEPHDAMVLAGLVQFDSIHVYRMPRLALTTPLRYHIARPGQSFEVNCTALGINELGASVRFELRDHLGRKLDDQSVPLRTPPGSPSSIAKRSHMEKSVNQPHYVSIHASDMALDGEADWKLKLDEPGLYRVRVNLGMGTRDSQRREILIGVMPEHDPVRAGPFGWSLPEFGDALNPKDVPELVRTFGAGWVKLPVWFDPSNPEAGDKIVALTERLKGLGTQCIGRIDQPPPKLRDVFAEGDDPLYAINVFQNPSDWEPALEPVLTRMGMNMTWFQLGADDDNSFVGVRDLAGLLTQVRTRMQSYNQELKLAIAWNWLDPLPQTTSPACNATHYSAVPQLTADELVVAIANSPRTAELWVSLDPLDGSQYCLLDRVRDLTRRMVAIKGSPASAAFVSDPFRPELRLFAPHHSVGEMLIPWHTLVSTIGEANYLGSIDLPGGSVNHVFQRGEQGIMLLWNDTPTTEQLFLGESIEAKDIWGKPIQIDNVTSERGTAEQALEIGPWPIIARGVDLDLIRFRQRFVLDIKNLTGLNGVERTIPLLMENTLPQSASGRLAVVSPSLLMGGRAEMLLQLPSGSKYAKGLPVVVRTDASAGNHQLRFDFDLIAHKPYHFSIYRSIALGLGDIELVWSSVRQDDQTIDLRVEVHNNTNGAVSFDCKLFPPGRAYERFRVTNATPGLTHHDLQVKLPALQTEREAWLRCEQSDSGRVLNYRIKI